MEWEKQKSKISKSSTEIYQKQVTKYQIDQIIESAIRYLKVNPQAIKLPVVGNPSMADITISITTDKRDSNLFNVSFHFSSLEGAPILSDKKNIDLAVLSKLAGLYKANKAEIDSELERQESQKNAYFKKG